VTFPEGKPETLSFETFQDTVRREFDLPNIDLAEGTPFEAIGLDSIGMYELLLLVEELAGNISEDEILSWFTLGDAYRSLQKRLG
jgi:acyl carrier protein